MSYLALLRLRLHLATLTRATHPDPPHGKDGKFYSAGTAGGHDPVARDESFHPRTTTGEPVGGTGFALHRESEHLRDSLAKLHALEQEHPGIKAAATWRGHQGYHAIMDHRGSLETQLKSQGEPSLRTVRELQALYTIYQRRLGLYGSMHTAGSYVVKRGSPAEARLQRESARIKSYLARYGYVTTARQHLLTGPENKDLTAAVDAGIAQEQALGPVRRLFSPSHSLATLHAAIRRLAA